MLCPIKVNNNAIVLTVHTSCYFVLDILCVKDTGFFKIQNEEEKSSLELNQLTQRLSYHYFFQFLLSF